MPTAERSRAASFRWRSNEWTRRRRGPGLLPCWLDEEFDSMLVVLPLPLLLPLAALWPDPDEPDDPPEFERERRGDAAP